MPLDHAAMLTDRHWRRGVLLAWLLLCSWFLWQRWGGIHWFSLGDTDDNLRMVQVRDWLNGQGWFDLRQYRLNAPDGADIHWSRIVDLPIAALVLVLRPFAGDFGAERWAAALAPLIPLGVMMTGVALTTRRLVGPLAPWPAFIALAFSTLLTAMFMPLRIDHHGWQLAMVALVVAGLADPVARRGGLTAGLASAMSLAIGMEMMPYLALAGAGLVLRWAYEGEAEAPRVRAYGLSIALGVALGYLGFASWDNRGARCDALTPVWLSSVFAAGAGALMLGLMRRGTGWHRLGAAAGVGAMLAAGFILLWPQCLSNLEAISPEAKRLWFDNIREVRPVYRQSTSVIVQLSASIGIGLIGHGLWLWHERKGPRFAPVLVMALMALAAALMLLWQGRAGAAAQLLALPGTAALIVLAGERLINAMPRARALTLLGLLTLALAGGGAQLALLAQPAPKSKAKGAPRATATRIAARCSTMPAHAPLRQVKAGKMFTFVDLAPRLITLTRHSAITGPYHRNHALILDVHTAFRATPDAAHATVMRHHADYVLICPGSPESTLYQRDAPQGFYARLAAANAPDWLERVPLPARSPFMLWRVKREIAAHAQVLP